MVNRTDPVESNQFATAAEVDGIRRTLDEFMKSQEETNNTVKASLDQLLKHFSNTPV